MGEVGDKLELRVTGPDGITRNAMPLTQSITWGGAYNQVARTLDFAMAVSQADGTLPVVDCPPGSGGRFLSGGEVLFDGFCFSRQRDTLADTVEVSCADRGLYLKKSQAAYKFRSQTPETIAGRVAADFGIKVGALARTGVSISRNFPGVSLYQIVQTAYTLAAAATGERYMVRFRGDALEVIAKKQSDKTPVLRPGASLISLTATDSVENMVNQVIILDKDGTRVGAPIGRAEDVAKYGLFQTAITQTKGKDAVAEARKRLEDGGLEQKITAQVRGCTDLIAGDCVVLQEPVTGLYGLCWIDSDTHIWKGGDYTTKLVLNFRSLMDEIEAGKA